MKKFYAVGIRRDADGKLFAMWVTFDESNDLTMLFGTFISSKICEKKSEAIAMAAEFNAIYGQPERGE